MGLVASGGLAVADLVTWLETQYCDTASIEPNGSVVIWW